MSKLMNISDWHIYEMIRTTKLKIHKSEMIIKAFRKLTTDQMLGISFVESKTLFKALDELESQKKYLSELCKEKKRENKKLCTHS